MKYFILILLVAVALCMPNVALAGCQSQTIIIDGRMLICTVCYDVSGRPISTTCY